MPPLVYLRSPEGDVGLFGRFSEFYDEEERRTSRSSFDASVSPEHLKAVSAALALIQDHYSGMPFVANQGRLCTLWSGATCGG